MTVKKIIEVDGWCLPHTQAVRLYNCVKCSRRIGAHEAKSLAVITDFDVHPSVWCRLPFDNQWVRRSIADCRIDNCRDIWSSSLDSDFMRAIPFMPDAILCCQHADNPPTNDVISGLNCVVCDVMARPLFYQRHML